MGPELDTLLELTRALESADRLDDLIWEACERFGTAYELDDCVIYLNDESGKLVQSAAFGPKNAGGGLITDPLELPIGSGIVGASARDGAPVLVHDLSDDQRYVIDDAPRRAELAVPIIDRGEVLGVIDSESASPGYYRARHLRTFLLLGSILAPRIRLLQEESRARHADVAAGLTAVLEALPQEALIFGSRTEIYRTSGVDILLRGPDGSNLRAAIEAARLASTRRRSLETRPTGHSGGQRRRVSLVTGMFEVIATRLPPAWNELEVMVLVSPIAAPAALSDASRERLRDEWRLTPREVEVFTLLALRATNSEIARTLGISPSTARHHTEHILSKTGMHSRRELPGLLSSGA